MIRPTLIALLAFLVVSPASGDGAPPVFIAVESFHAAASSVGRVVPIDSLIIASGTVGSESQETESWLIEQARTNDLAAVAVEGWTIADLRSSPSPFVAFVRAAPDVDGADFAVYIDSVGDRHVTARIGRIGTVDIPLGAWSELWDGAGVVIDLPGRADDSRAERVGATLTSIIVAASLASAIGVVSLVRRGEGRRVDAGPWASSWRASMRNRSLLAVAQAMVLVALAATVGWTFQRFDPNRAHVDGVLIATAHESVSIDLSVPEAPVYEAEVREIDAKQLRSWLANEPPLLVDARNAGSFGSRRIAGSIGLATFGPSTVRLALAGIPRDRLIVVYCSDLSCPRGHQASAVLERAGFTNVHLYPPGWADLQSWRVFEFVSGDPNT